MESLLHKLTSKLIVSQMIHTIMNYYIQNIHVFYTVVYLYSSLLKKKNTTLSACLFVLLVERANLRNYWSDLEYSFSVRYFSYGGS